MRNLIVVVSGVVSIAAVLAWSQILIGSHGVAPTPSTAPAPIVDAKAYTTTLAPSTGNPLEKNLEMLALLDLHRYARNEILSEGYIITVRFEDGSRRTSQKNSTEPFGLSGLLPSSERKYPHAYVE